ncbi:MAG: DUF6053 domain-containing protein [Lysobacter sp.]
MALARIPVIRAESVGPEGPPKNTSRLCGSPNFP